MPLIERAARALAESESGHDVWRGLDAELRDELKENVRAVLKAIRVPTLCMCIAGHEHLEQEGGLGDSEGVQDTWQAMIDAALDTN